MAVSGVAWLAERRPLPEASPTPPISGSGRVSDECWGFHRAEFGKCVPLQFLGIDQEALENFATFTYSLSFLCLSGFPALVGSRDDDHLRRYADTAVRELLAFDWIFECLSVCDLTRT